MFITNQVRAREGSEVPFSNKIIKRYIEYNMHFIRDKGTNLVWVSVLKDENHLASYRMALVKVGITIIKKE